MTRDFNATTRIMVDLLGKDGQRLYCAEIDSGSTQVLSLGYDMPSSAGIQYSIQSHQNQDAEKRRINGKSNSKLRRGRSQQWEGNSTNDKQKEGNSMRREKNLKKGENLFKVPIRRRFVTWRSWGGGQYPLHFKSSHRLEFEC